MPSPFPGMNPYLEQEDVWHDFHERFLPAAAEVLGPQVQPDFIVKIDEHLSIYEVPDDPRRFLGRADLAIASKQPPESAPPGVALLDAPAQVRLPAADVVGESFIEIRDRRSRDVVCVIALLSPSNKRPGSDREQYLSKRRQLLASPAHRVEIDLLRVGEPMPAADRTPCAYSVMISRATARPIAGFWSIGLRDPLPTIRIPLRAPHEDARLSLQAVLDRVYDGAGYAFYIYEGAPVPAPSADDDGWARSLIAPRA